VTAESCSPPNQTVDPGETITGLLSLTNVGPLVRSQLSATLLPGGNVTEPGAAQSYGVLVPGGPAVARPFTFTAGGSCGQTLRAAFALSDAGLSLGRIYLELPLGRVIATNATFSTGPILIPTNGAAQPYPSTIVVSGVTGAVQKVTVTLKNLTHPLPDQLDMLLRGPGGQAMTLLSDTGGLLGITNVTLVFDSTVTNRLPDNDQILTGIYSPTNYGSSDAYPLPAPAPPYGTSLDVFKGKGPNGVWQLFVYDDTLRDGGSLDGWSLTIDAAATDCCEGAPGADLSLTMIAAPPSVPLDRNVNFVSTVFNRGPAPATGVVLSNWVPNGSVFVSANSTVGSCNQDAGLLRCTVGTLASNAGVNITLTVKALEPGLLSNLATVSLNERELVPTNNTATARAVITTSLVSIQNASVTEAVGSVSALQFVTTLSPSMSRTVSVQFATANETAVAGVDYQPTNGTLVFLPGETSKIIRVGVLDDLLNEPTETLTVNLFNPDGVILNSSQAIGSVLDNDPAPSLSISDASVLEGDTGFTEAQFHLLLSAPSGQAIQTSYTAINGTAVAGSDFIATNGSLTLLPGETNRILPILVRGDRLNEFNETFFVSISPPSNAILTDNQGRATILDDDSLPTFAVEAGPVLAESCLPTNGIVDPGEIVSVQFLFRNLATATARATNLVATLRAGGGVLAPSGPQTIGAVLPGGSAAGTFTFTSGSACGGTINATFQLQEDGRDLGSVMAALAIGQSVITLAEDFDGVSAPLFPPGWTAIRTGSSPPWRTTTTLVDTPPNSAMTPNAPTASTNALISPVIQVESFQAELDFRHGFNTESNFDGGTLEISMNGGPFLEFLSAGGRFLQGGYNGTIDFFDPGWTGNSGGFLTVRAALPPGAAGAAVQFRWRFTSDSSAGGLGWFVDSISLRDGFVCCGSGEPRITAITVEGNLVLLQWSALPTRTYQVQYKQALDAQEWITLPGDVVAQGPMATRLDQPGPVEQRFYRVLLLP
jgi:uncharacterized repeat protein (TIGR01451 family)